jgi:GDPmannose 4,6-dehydratase
MNKTALITGINGMDGSHLADFLLDKGYTVYGVERRSSIKNRVNTKHLENKITILQGDLTDQNSLLRCLKESNPDEVYNLAAQSFVGESWNTPEFTSDVTGLGVLRILEAIREFNPHIKFYQASSSEMFGRMVENPANENTPFYPRSPYGVAKLYGHWITKNYRESYGMFISNGILFNHEGERRGETFVTRKITKALGVIKNYIDHGHFDFPTLKLGNLDAKRDWGYAKDFVEGMWMMLQAESPDDYVLATGEAYSVREFIEEACKVSGLNITWVGSGVSEKAILDNGITIIEVDEKYYRPAEVSHLLGDSTKARNELGWNPKVRFKELVKIMMTHDIKNTRTP